MYEFFQIVDELHDDPTLFPVLSAPQQPLPFELEPADGDTRLGFESRNVSVAQRTAAGWTELRTFRDLKFDVVITDARIVVYCEKWTKGGGWRGFGVGGLAFAAAANAVSQCPGRPLPQGQTAGGPGPVSVARTGWRGGRPAWPTGGCPAGGQCRQP